MVSVNLREECLNMTTFKMPILFPIKSRTF